MSIWYALRAVLIATLFMPLGFVIWSSNQSSNRYMRLLKEKAAVIIGSSDLEIAAAEAVRFMHRVVAVKCQLIEN